VSAIRQNFTLIASKLQNAPKDLLDKFENKVIKCTGKVTELESLLSDIEENRILLAKYFCEEEKKFRIEDCLQIFYKLCSKIADAEKVIIINSLLCFNNVSEKIIIF